MFWSEWSPKRMPLALRSTSRDLSKAQILTFLQACGSAISTCSTIWSHFWKWQNCSKAQHKTFFHCFKHQNGQKVYQLFWSTMLDINETLFMPPNIIPHPHGWKWLCQIAKNCWAKKNYKYWIQLYNISSRFIWLWLIWLHLKEEP